MNAQLPIVKPYVCEDCGEPCNGVLKDFGIGSYEFWGQRGRDVQMAWVSECCDATLLDPDTGCEADPPEPNYPPEKDPEDEAL